MVRSRLAAAGQPLLCAHLTLSLHFFTKKVFNHEKFKQKNLADVLQPVFTVATLGSSGAQFLFANCHRGSVMYGTKPHQKCALVWLHLLFLERCAGSHRLPGVVCAASGQFHQ